MLAHVHRPRWIQQSFGDKVRGHEIERSSDLTHVVNDASEILVPATVRNCLWPSMLAEPRYFDHPSSCLTVVSESPSFCARALDGPKLARVEQSAPRLVVPGPSRLSGRRRDSRAHEPFSSPPH